MTPTENIAAAHADYKRRIEQARSDRDARVNQAEEDFRSTIEAARGWFIGQIDELLAEDLDNVSAPPQPPGVQEPESKPPSPTLDLRAELKRECIDLERGFSGLPDGEREIRQAKSDTGLDPDRTVEQSKVKAHRLGDYRAELKRRLALFQPAPEVIEPPDGPATPEVEPEPPEPVAHRAATGAQAELEGLF